MPINRGVGWVKQMVGIMFKEVIYSLTQTRTIHGGEGGGGGVWPPETYLIYRVQHEVIYILYCSYSYD